MPTMTIRIRPPPWWMMIKMMMMIHPLSMSLSSWWSTLLIQQRQQQHLSMGCDRQNNYQQQHGRRIIHNSIIMTEAFSLSNTIPIHPPLLFRRTNNNIVHAYNNNDNNRELDDNSIVTPSNNNNMMMITTNNTDDVDVIICGGGPTGLLTAIMLAKTFPNYSIQLFERNIRPPPSPYDDQYWSDGLDRRYLIGLGGRGISSLERFHVWDNVVSKHTITVPGRKDWTNTKNTKTKTKKNNNDNNDHKNMNIHDDHDYDDDDDDDDGVVTFKTERKDKYVTQVLPRDKLVSILYHHIVNNDKNGTTTDADDDDDAIDDDDTNNNIQQQELSDQHQRDTTNNSRKCGWGPYRNVVLNYGYNVEPERINLLNESMTDRTITSSSISSVRDKRVLVRVEKTLFLHDDDDDNDEFVDTTTTTTNVSMIMSANFVIAADGSARTFANEMERLDGIAMTRWRGEVGENKLSSAAMTTTTSKHQQQQQRFTVVRYPDDNQRVYKNLSFRIPDSWRKDMNYAVRTDRTIFDALPANANGDYVGVLLLNVKDDMAQSDVDPKTFRDFLRQEIPQFVNMFSDDVVTAVAKRPPSTLPMFRYVTPRMHYDYKTLLLGDCAHTVKPYFGMGANSALEDVKMLSQCIDNNDGDLLMAVDEFSKLRSPDIETLVRTSHRLDRPGLEGVVTFLIPIILDGIFSKLLPTVFAPNVISMLQNEEITFQQAVERKRLDRLGQIVILTGIVGLLFGPLLTMMTSILDSII